MNFFFRVDSSATLGFGHVSRCLELAKKLKKMGGDVFFICIPYKNSLISKIIKNKFKLISLDNLINVKKELMSFNEFQELDASSTIQSINKYNVDWLIVDNYYLDSHWEQSMSLVAKNIMVIDDEAKNIHCCDLLLNQNSPDLDFFYKDSIKNNKTLLLLGPKYCLLNNDFLKYRPKYPKVNDKIKRVLIFFTGGDDHGETLKAMRGVWEYNNMIYADIVIGAALPNIDDIKIECQKYNWNLHIQVDNLAEIMKDADFMIGSCGINAWERCVIGMPSISVVLASNQKFVSQTLKQNDASYVLEDFNDTSYKDYCNIMKKMTKDKTFKMANNAYNLVDGLGINRVSEILMR
jgi:UDP-2,4-diacetamido-2,4,6-trideoxy-beta-L-altropyranose hydrolase